jgi:multidrug resistance efflux pump
MHQLSVEHQANRTRLQRERLSTSIAIEELIEEKINAEMETADALRLASILEGEINVLERQRSALLTALARLEVRAPISGIISRMSEGLATANLVQRGEELFLIHDERSRIEGEIVLTDEQYKDAFVGQRVRLQLRAWNHYKYGTLEGRITAISRQKMVPRTYPTPNAMYVARVDLLTEGKERVEVGYLFDAKLLQANVPLLEYLLKKVRIG